MENTEMKRKYRKTVIPGNRKINMNPSALNPFMQELKGYQP